MSGRLKAGVSRRLLPRLERWAQAGETHPPAPDTDADAAGDMDDSVSRSEEAAARVGAGVLEAYDDVFSRFADERPSYMHALHETKRRMAVMREFGVRHPYWEVNDKLGGYRYVAALGLDHPAVLARHDEIRDVDPGAIPRRFLVKPVGGSTNRGVFGLDLEDRPATGAYTELLTGRELTWAQVVEEYESHVVEKRISAALVVEELLRHPRDTAAIPDDFKVYCFYDRAALVMQRHMNATADRTAWRFKFWDREWVDLGPIKFADRCDPDLPPPVHGDAIIEAAERLGAALRLPFVRLDFYDTDRGAVFGEVT
ncbi:MAG: ATP-grasp fold amidoligase family protein [Acidimicrobiales bacterium]